MKSMTGFGSGEAPLGPGRVVLDLRSVNHRYLDVRVRLPPELAELSMFIEQRARETLSRGRFDLGVRLEGTPPTPQLDVERARTLFRELEHLRDELCPTAEVPFAVLLGMPALYTAPASFGPEAAEAALRSAFDTAVTRLDEMREREGAALAAEIAARLGACRKLRANLARRVPEAVLAHEARLRSRVARLSQDAPGLDPGRLEAEIALLSERMDVTEELVRLESHFEQFQALLGERNGTGNGKETPVGRRLDFLLQEIARETNTVGAKCQDADLGHLVVEMKSEVERMREQVQNVE